MKIAIIYSTSSKSTKKACKLLSSKIKANVQLIPIEKAKTACLLKYNFIILAGSAFNGKVQSALKRYISRNIKTLKEKPIALVLNCEENIDTRDRLNKTFSHELVESSYISSNFGYELNPEEGNFIDKRKTNNIINKYKKDGKSLPMLNLNEIDNFADYINGMIEKRVD
ncbi:flavodoxin domain-containing protein [Methanobrevibacter sp.]|uniref:flavodoxin family protein n=1 Tax=Methanobrevibacter sp. TaxID=66852 RepID=UPI0025FADF33|nr:flavodoxin domain-containing protein [Methanobrevibacter sp.]MBQ2831319.1 flavodoxin [Methanobrevibacter sp.]